MRILVAGRSGQVARSLAAAASEHPNGAATTILTLGRPQLDLTDPDSVAAAVRDATPDIIINAAAYTAVDKAESEENAAFALNRDGARHLAAAAATRGLPIVHISTDYVFNGRKTEPYVETDPTGPESAYGRSKQTGEEAVAAANPRHLIVRTAWVHSPYGANFVKTMLRLAETRDRLNVVDDQHGSPTYAPHLAEALLSLARRAVELPEMSPLWGIYHAAGHGETTWCGLARWAFAEAAQHALPHAAVSPITTAEYPTPAKRPANSRLDCAKLQANFGLQLPAWQAGVKECVARLASGTFT